MKVALVALSARGAFAHCIEALALPLSSRCELALFLPAHYSGECGVTVYPFRTGLTRAGAFLNFANPVAATKLWKQIAAVKPDVIHVYTGDGYPWTPILAGLAACANKPFVLTIHDPEPHPGNLPDAAASIIRRFGMKGAHIHIHSARHVALLRRCGMPLCHISVVPLPNVGGRFTRHLNKTIARERLVLFFGRLEYYKGIDQLVEVAGILRNHYRFAIAGPGTLPTTLEAVIRSDPDTFELHNAYISDAEVARLFQRAAVCVLPYRQVTQSLVPGISASFGVPVVGSALGAFVEDIPLVNGILVAPGESRALAAGIIKATGTTPVSPQQREPGIVAQQLVEVYRNAISRKKAG